MAKLEQLQLQQKSSKPYWEDSYISTKINQGTAKQPMPASLKKTTALMCNASCQTDQGCSLQKSRTLARNERPSTLQK